MLKELHLGILYSHFKKIQDKKCWKKPEKEKKRERKKEKHLIYLGAKATMQAKRGWNYIFKVLRGKQTNEQIST